MKKPATFIATIFIALIGVGHLFRVLFNIDLTVYGIMIPLWASGIAAVFCGALSILLWKERRS